MKVSSKFIESVINTSNEIMQNKSSHKISGSIKYVTDSIKEIRKYNHKRILDLLEQEEEDSALFCPISLFGTMDFGRLEVAHTRTLGWLIDPSKNHDFKYILTEKFFKLFGLELNIKTIKDFRVETEKTLVKDGETFGRADIYVTYSKDDVLHTLIVEAKVDANLEEDQYFRYKKFLTKINGDKKLVILSKSGDVDNLDFLDCPIGDYQSLYRLFLDAFKKLPPSDSVWFLKYYLAGIAQDILGLPLLKKRKIEETNLPYEILRILG